MAKRERYPSPISCPTCGKTGQAEWEENENPMHAGGQLDQTLESVSEGFQIAGRPGKASIICTHCNETI